MELTKLYDMQQVLKDRIGYKNEDKGDKSLLAMIVEFAECAQEWRGFKYWSKDQEPRVEVFFHNDLDEMTAIYKNPLLEEYVDGLHFVLEQGLDLGIRIEEVFEKDISKWETIENQFLAIIRTASMLPCVNNHRYVLKEYYRCLVYEYIGLGYMLGFTDEQITAAYLEKNRTNHERQDNSY